MIITFLNPQVKQEFLGEAMHPLLRAIMLDAACYAYYKYGITMVVTSIFRAGDTDSVHGYWRGGDMDEDGRLLPIQKKGMEEYTNKRFQYDHKRPEKQVCKYHTVKGRGGDHLHYQVHQNTKAII